MEGGYTRFGELQPAGLGAELSGQAGLGLASPGPAQLPKMLHFPNDFQGLWTPQPQISPAPRKPYKVEVQDHSGGPEENLILQWGIYKVDRSYITMRGIYHIVQIFCRILQDFPGRVWIWRKSSNHFPSGIILAEF